jgi:hypothetical protein
MMTTAELQAPSTWKLHDRPILSLDYPERHDAG